MKKTAIILSALAGAIAITAFAFFVYYLSVTAGVRLDCEKLTLNEPHIRFYADDGTQLNLPALKRCAPLSELNDYVGEAFVSVEDKRFYLHRGFDYKRIAKATVKNIASLSFREGASTISQQLIKNTHLSGEKTVKRKLKEMKLTRQLEKRYSKREILSLYLNSIYFGHSAFGIEAASNFYFGREAKTLSPAQAATLAALVKSPNRYSPFRDREKCLNRRNFVLSLMKERGAIDKAQYDLALKEPLPDAPFETQNSLNAYLARTLTELNELFPDENIMERDLKVYTFLDGALQKSLEALEWQDDICAIVTDRASQGVRAFHSTLAGVKRLPASTLKPLLVYAPAVEENFISPATPILDEKTDFGGYCPSDYNAETNGYMSARYALAHSVNIPAVKILNSMGVERAAGYLEKMGLRVPDEDKTLALALGGMKEGFTLSALADGYSTLSDGNYCASSTVKRIETGRGKTVYTFRPTKRRVFSEDTAYLVTDMLVSAVQEGTAKKLKPFPFSIAAKTGTGANANGQNIDAYTLAYTSEHTVGVWLGNRSNAPIATTGGSAPAGFVSQILKTVYENHTPKNFTPCDKVTKICFDRQEYETNHRIVRADSAAPPLATLSDLFRTSFLPADADSRFTRPSIEKPSIFVKNGAVCIQLCQAEYYEYVIKRKNNGKTVTIYEGKYKSTICDNSVESGQAYEYTVIPRYKETEGEPVKLPSVYIPKSSALPDDWWE